MASPLHGRRCLVLYGPTRAWLDPVRYLANASSGRLGALIVERLLARGASVQALVGPGATLPSRHAALRVIEVEDIAGLPDLCREQCAPQPPEIVVMAMAVLDYAPSTRLEHKRGADDQPWTLTLYPTPKIIDQLRALAPRALLVGFKLGDDPETLTAQATEMCRRSGADLALANLAGRTDPADHWARLLDPDGETLAEARGKTHIAATLVEVLEKTWQARSQAS